MTAILVLATLTQAEHNIAIWKGVAAAWRLLCLSAEHLFAPGLGAKDRISDRYLRKPPIVERLPSNANSSPE
jgi:hypothetical protein